MVGTVGADLREIAKGQFVAYLTTVQAGVLDIIAAGDHRDLGEIKTVL